MTLSGRLRDQAARVDLYEHAETMREAADRIEALEAALRAAELCMDNGYRCAASASMRDLLYAGREAARATLDPSVTD